MIKKNLKEIIESLESKQLYRYRYDRTSEKNGTICKNCIHYEDGYCNFLKDNVKSFYTCIKFEKADENGEKED